MSRASRGGDDGLYDYGPPVTQGTPESPQDDMGTPHDDTGEVVESEGGDPMVPPDNTGSTTDPGGSPTDEVQEAHDPSITALDPDTAVVGADVEVTVTGTNFSEASSVEVDQLGVATVYVSATELTASVPDPGTAVTVEVTVRNPFITEESNSVDFTWTAAEE